MEQQPLGLSTLLDGKNILITGGGGTGVGFGVCEAVHRWGGRLLINDVDPEKAQAAASRYPEAIAIAGDVSQGEEVSRMFETLTQQCGPVHGLVNNAGVGLSKPTHEVEEAEFDRLYNIDVRAVWLMTRAFLRHAYAHRIQGHIVNVSSVHAHSTQSGYAIYSSAKNAVEAFTRGVALEIGRHGMRCNAIAPGYVHAEQNYDLIRHWAEDPAHWVEAYKINQQALPYFVDAVDCGHTVAFLLSDLSKAITGQTLYVDAGKTSLLFNRDFTETDSYDY